MKRVGFILAFFSLLNGFSQPIPFPTPSHEGLNVNNVITKQVNETQQFQFGLWMQNRIMYNMSNIPGLGGTTFDSTDSYDFFRQRYRFGLDFKLFNTSDSSNVGVYIQPEFRGGWGGSSPDVSDPRGAAPVNNPYNRLQPRGLRYAFAYYEKSKKLNFSAGILPLTDQLGRTLFDADWDFNVGGIVLGGVINKLDYRLGYVRLIDGVGGTRNQIGSNTDFVLADASLSISENSQIGVSAYYLTNTLNVLTIKSEGWYGLTAKTKIKTVDLNGMFILNNGIISGIDTSGQTKDFSHTGTAVKFEIGIPIKKAKISMLAITTSGDESEEIKQQFMTPYKIVGTAGYWGYTHIFTPQGPSDVNDFGLEIGNGGFGLTTIQAKLDVPIIKDKLNAQAFGGWFQATKKRNNSLDMGMEYGVMATISLAKNLNLEIGGASATIGNFYTQKTVGLYELFSRLQFVW